MKLKIYLSERMHNLRNLQSIHSKSKQISNESLDLQTYLKPGNNATIQEKSVAFEARSRMMQVI